MADKVSFTTFGSKKKVSKVRRKSKSKPKTDFDADALLDEVLAAKKLAEDSISSAQSSAIASLPFLEFSVTQKEPTFPGVWNTLNMVVSNTGTGPAVSITISFNNLKMRGKSIIDFLEPGAETVFNLEINTDSNDEEITRMDVYYHTIEGDTFTAVRRDKFPNNYQSTDIFVSEIPPGEEQNTSKYEHRNVMSGDFNIVCSKCGARAPTSFRICGKCGSRLQKRIDRPGGWGSNLSAATAVEDKREILIGKLRKLGELKDKGMLNDKEFTAAKSRLLD